MRLQVNNEVIYFNEIGECGEQIKNKQKFIKYLEINKEKIKQLLKTLIQILNKYKLKQKIYFDFIREEENYIWFFNQYFYISIGDSGVYIAFDKQVVEINEEEKRFLKKQMEKGDIFQQYFIKKELANREFYEKIKKRLKFVKYNYDYKLYIYKFE